MPASRCAWELSSLVGVDFAGRFVEVAYGYVAVVGAFGVLGKVVGFGGSDWGCVAEGNVDWFRFRGT